MKKFFAGLIAGMLIFTGVGEVSARSAPIQTDSEIWVRGTAEWYGVSEKEILNAVKAGKHFKDIEFAALLSKISGKSFTQVLSMKNDWRDVMKKLNITPEKYDAACKELMIKGLAAESELPESTVKNLLDNHYHPLDIKIAGRLAKASGKDVKEILDSKKINQRWADIAEQLNVDKNLAEAEEKNEDAPPQEEMTPPAE